MSRSKPAPSREQLLKVATRMFATRGFSRTTLRAIADKAGVNQGMIHYYWRTKIALYEEVYSRVFEDFGRMVDESFSGTQVLDLQSSSEKEKMVKIIVEEAFRLIERQPFIAIIIARHMMGDVPGTEHLTEKYARPLFKRGALILGDYMKKGIIKQQNIRLSIASFCFIFMGYRMGGDTYLFPQEKLTDSPASRRKLAVHIEELLFSAMFSEF
jgi:AcrR family transcriptional regulator